jgi:cytochrome c peroxidase
LAFSDLLSKSIGVNNLIGRRNAPTLANVAYLPYYTREGGVPSLEMQILVPIQEHDEFGHNIVDIVAELKNDNQLNDLSLKAYDRNLDAFVLTRAIATFERSIISGNSFYDRNELSESQKRGKQLFFSEKTNCSRCHGGFNFTNNEILNNGLYENYDDPGRFRLTGLESDRAKFKVPTLRNIEVTAPYMFDGSLATLEEVVDHYISGGKSHKNKSSLIAPLTLSETEKSDLVAFLKALTDQEFLNKKIYSNE